MRLKVILIAAGLALLALAGWRLDGLPFIPNQPYSDATISHWPAALYLRESVAEGAFPLWRETIMAGQPFAANPLNKTAYPLQWLVVLFPPALHLNLMIGLHLVIAGWGMWRWTRSEGLQPAGAALSTAAYVFAPKLLGHLGAGHLDLVYALAWWPWLLWSLGRRSRRSTVQTALFAALLFLADVRLSFFALTIAAAYELWPIIRRREWGQINTRLILVPLFLLLTASVIVPLLTWQPYLNRASLTPQEAGVFPLEWGHFAGLLLPAHKGNPETITYSGLPALVLAGMALVSRPRRFAFWGLVIGVSVLYALGENGPLWPLAVRFVPGLLWFRVPSRAWFGVVLAASLLAGHGLDGLLAWAEFRRENLSISVGEGLRPSPASDSTPGLNPVNGRLRGMRLAAAGGMVAALLCGGVTLVVLPLPASAGISVLVIGLGTAGLLLLTLYGKVRGERLATLFLLLVLADLLWTGRQWVTWQGPDVWLGRQAALAERLLADDAARVYSPTYSLEQQVAAAYGLRLFGGIDPFQLSGVVQAIGQGGGVSETVYSVVQPPLIGVTGNDLTEANRGAVLDTYTLAEWGVSHVIAAYPLEDDRVEWVDTVDGVLIYRNRDFVPEYATRIPDWPPDWPDLPEGAQVERANRITLLAAVVSAVSLLGVLAFLAMGFRRTRTNPTSPGDR